MTFSINCVRLVKKFEGLYLIAYRCPAGIYTIGWGHTSVVQEGQQIDEPTAEQLLNDDLTIVATQLNKMLPPSASLNQNQFDALCSLCFNLAGGPWSLPRQAPRMWSDLIHGEMPQAAGEFLDMDHAFVAGTLEILPGLRERRIEEAKLFLS